MMVKLEKDLRSKNISQLEREHFYEKLMALKQEQAAHIRLVERVYRSEVYTEQPRGILKTTNIEVMRDNIEWELFAFSCHNSAFKAAKAALGVIMSVCLSWVKLKFYLIPSF